VRLRLHHEEFCETNIIYRYSNLFNAIPRHSALRLSVYSTLLSLASENDELDVLAISSEDVDQWLSEWQITEEEKLAFLQSLETAFTRAHDAYAVSSLGSSTYVLTRFISSQGAYKYALAHAKLVPSGSSEAQSVAARVIASALQLPSLFDFDPILQLDVVSAATSHPLHALLQIFVGEGLPEYQSWVTANGAVVSEHCM
jgi:translation initiation factor 3 subunit M